MKCVLTIATADPRFSNSSFLHMPSVSLRSLATFTSVSYARLSCLDSLIRLTAPLEMLVVGHPALHSMRFRWTADFHIIPYVTQRVHWLPLSDKLSHSNMFVNATYILIHFSLSSKIATPLWTLLCFFVDLQTGLSTTPYTVLQCCHPSCSTRS